MNGWYEWMASFPGWTLTDGTHVWIKQVWKMDEAIHIKKHMQTIKHFFK